MPNWVFNSLVVSGEKSELERMVAKLNQPFTTMHTTGYNGANPIMEEYTYDNPVLAFWNIVAPDNLDTYFGKEKEKINMDNFIQSFTNAVQNDQSWYYWNLRNWGCKWDVAVSNDDKYSDTSMEWTDNGEVMYRFNTAWSPAEEAMTKLSEMFPTLTFDFEYEEEQGWGGKAEIIAGEYNLIKQWDIPSSHADYENSWMNCACETEPDYSDYWFEDCPVDTTKYKWDEEMSAWLELEEVSDQSAMLEPSN
jgi:hypothetical protein